MRVFLLPILITFFIGLQPVSAQDWYKPEQTKGNTVICYSIDQDQHTFIAPSKEILRQMAARGQNTASIEVVYVGFPQAAQDAFQFAVDIWESILLSPVNIRIRAEWAMLDQGTLGSASTTSFFRNFKNTPQFQTWYPVALAEKIAGEELNESSDFDITANFNEDNNWYLGTDLNPGPGQHDLVTVVLHEIAHGLGFIDTMFEDGTGIGSYGLSGFPSIFDFYCSTPHPDRLQLTDTALFDNPSTELGDAMTGNALFFNSPLAELPGNILPKLFAPTTFNPGSSVSHLDETTYRAGTPNSLMTSSLGTVEAIHDPGPITLSMFAEMGWVHTYIDHDPLQDIETFNQTFPIVASVISDSALIGGSIELHYSLDSFATAPVVVGMNATGNPDEYSADLPNTGAPRTMSYFISAEDNTNRTYTNPGQAPEFFYSFNAGPDTIKPVIVHEPIAFILITDETVDLSAVVTDNFDLQSVTLEYAINGTDQTPIDMTLDMTPDVEDTYLATLDFPMGSVAVNDVVTYRIVAVDETSNNNLQTNPKTGVHEFTVDEVSSVQQSYENDFNQASTDFVGNAFSITTSSGFNDGAIQSDHPYLDGSGPNDESNYIYQLRIPIEVQASNSTIKFNEVVLIEPGEPGTVFGDQQFWDYAIVEGSLDDGNTWTPLLDGYDSRDDADWLARYNSSIVGNNSTATGSSTLFKNRVINMQDTYNTGDEVLLRFRLFADQAAYGWGWAIDDLNIQGTVVTDIPDIFKIQEVKLYPNPTQGQVRLSGKTQSSGQEVRLAVLNVLGDRLYSESWAVRNSEFNKDLNLNSLPAGIYFIQVQIDAELHSYKIIKSQ